MMYLQVLTNSVCHYMHIVMEEDGLSKAESVKLLEAFKHWLICDLSVNNAVTKSISFSAFLFDGVEHHFDSLVADSVCDDLHLMLCCNAYKLVESFLAHTFDAHS